MASGKHCSHRGSGVGHARRAGRYGRLASRCVSLDDGECGLEISFKNISTKTHFDQLLRGFSERLKCRTGIRQSF